MSTCNISWTLIYILDIEEEDGLSPYLAKGFDKAEKL